MKKIVFDLIKIIFILSAICENNIYMRKLEVSTNTISKKITINGNNNDFKLKRIS